MQLGCDINGCVGYEYYLVPFDEYIGIFITYIGYTHTYPSILCAVV